MPFGCALCSIVRECSLSVHEYHWSIVGQTGRHTSFGTRGSQLQILPLRPDLPTDQTAPEQGADIEDAANGCLNGSKGLRAAQITADAPSAEHGSFLAFRSRIPYLPWPTKQGLIGMPNQVIERKPNGQFAKGVSGN